MIEILAFNLIEGSDEEAFVLADKRVQAEFAYQQPGLLRRTTARSIGGGSWMVIDLWRSAEDADAADAKRAEDPAAAEFMSFVDRSTMRTARYLERPE